MPASSDTDNVRAISYHNTLVEGMSAGEDTAQQHQGRKWNEDDDDRETLQETFRILDNDENKIISIAEIEIAAASSNDLSEVVDILKAHFKNHQVTGVDEELFNKAIDTIPRVRGHRVQWAKGLLLHNLLARSLKRGTIVDGLKGLKAMSEQEVRNACEIFAKDAMELILSEWKALNIERSAHSQGTGSNSKFSMGDGLEASYGTLDDFYQGPEKRVGYPNPKVAEGMRIEHCSKPNHDSGFVTSNYQLYTKPSWEWCYILQLHPQKGDEIIASLKTEIPESLKTERKGQFPGVYEDFFWETIAECSFKRNIENTYKLIEDLKVHLEELKGLLKTDDEKCRGIKILHNQTLSIVFPRQLEELQEHEFRDRLETIFETSWPSMIDMKLFKLKRTYVEKKRENATDEIQGRMPPREREKSEEMKQMMHKAGLRLEEVWALCLYTGPMFFLYNARLRGFPQELIHPNNKFETTTFVIISGIVKLSRVSAIPKNQLLYRGMGGLRLPPAFREASAECTVKLAVTFVQTWDFIKDAVAAVEKESLVMMKQYNSEIDVRRLVISRDTRTPIWNVEVVVAKGKFDLLVSKSKIFTDSDIKKWSFHEELDNIEFTKQEPKQVAIVESSPDPPPFVAVVTAVLQALKKKGAQCTGVRILEIFKAKPEGFRGGVELGLMSTTSRKEIAIQYSTGKGSKRGIVFEIQAGRIDMGASLQCFSQYPGEEEFLLPPCSCVEVVHTPRIEFDKDGKEVVVYPVRVNVNLKCVTVEELEGRRKELHLAMFSNLIEEVFSQLKEKREASCKGKYNVLGETQLEMIIAALCQVKIEHETHNRQYYLHDNNYLELFNQAMVEKRFANVKFDLYTQTMDEAVLKNLPDAIKKFPWEVIVGESQTLDLKDWAVQDLEKKSKVFLAEQLRFTVCYLVAAGIRVRFDPPNLSARCVRISCNPQSLLNHVADRVSFLLSRYRSLCEVDIAERAAFDSLTIESWRHIFEDCPRLSTVNGSFMPNRLLRPTRGAGAALMVGYCQAWSAVSLDLTNLALGNEGLKLICAEMMKLGHLQYLFLDYNGLGVDCMQQFSEKILSLKNLKALSLDGNFIEANGVNLLCDSLKSMDSVERLSAKGNVIPMDLLPEKLMLPANILAGKGIIGGNKQLSLRGSINSVAWSPGRSKIAAGCEDGVIVIFDVHTGEHIKELKGHSDSVRSVAWSPDGCQIASGSADTTVIVWDAQTGEQKTRMDETESAPRYGCLASWCLSKKKTTGHTLAVNSVAWSPEGSKIASGSADQTIIVWDAVTGEQKTQLKGHTEWVQSVAWSPEGSEIASGSTDKTIIIWDAVTGEQKTQLKGHTNDVRLVAWSPEGSKIASGSYDKTIIIWDAETGEQKSQLKGHTAAVLSVAWSPGGDQIASGSSDKTLIIWDTVSGQQISKFEGHADEVRSVRWSPRGDQLASASNDKTVIIWNAKSGQQVSKLGGHTDYVRSVAWSPNGDQLVSASDDTTVIIWDAKSGQQVSKLGGHTHYVMSVAWSPDGNQIASGSNDTMAIIWNAASGQLIAKLEGHSGSVNCVAWSPNGAQLSSGSNDRTVIIWDVTNRQAISKFEGHTDAVLGVAWNLAGNLVASASGDKSVMIWDASSGQQVSKLEGHVSSVRCVVWSPNGELASASDDKTVIVWDAVSGKEVSKLGGHTGGVKSVAWNPIGDRLASGSSDKTLIIWDAISGAQVLKMEGHNEVITCLAWSPMDDDTMNRVLDASERTSELEACTVIAYQSNKSRIASGSDDNSVIIWDAEDGKEIWRLREHTSSVKSLAWSKTGSLLASGSVDKCAIVWDAKTGQRVSKLEGHSSAIVSLVWSQNDEELTCGCADGTVSRWTIKTGQRISGPDKFFMQETSVPKPAGKGATQVATIPRPLGNDVTLPRTVAPAAVSGSSQDATTLLSGLSQSKRLNQANSERCRCSPASGGCILQ